MKCTYALVCSSIRLPIAESQDSTTQAKAEANITSKRYNQHVHKCALQHSEACCDKVDRVLCIKCILCVVTNCYHCD
jgi:hypothetical protein